MLINRYAFEDVGIDKRKADYYMKHLRDRCNTKSIMMDVPMITRHGVITTARHPIINVNLKEAMSVTQMMLEDKLSPQRLSNWTTIYNVLKGIK